MTTMTVDRLNRSGWSTTWGRPMPDWYWRRRNVRVYRSGRAGIGHRAPVDLHRIRRRVTGQEPRLHLQWVENVSSGMQMLPDGRIRHWEARNGKLVDEWFEDPNPVLPELTDADRAEYLAWVDDRPEPLQVWLRGHLPTIDSWRQTPCWRLASTDGHYRLHSFTTAADDDEAAASEHEVVCTVDHVGGPGSRLMAAFLGPRVFGVPVDDLVPCGCGDFTSGGPLGGFVDPGAEEENDHG